MITLLKQIIPNFFRLGLIQVSSILLQLLLIPIVIHRSGIEANSKWLTALSASVLFSIIINFASNQSGPRALNEAEMINKKERVNQLLSLLFYVRLLFFLISIFIILLVYTISYDFGIYLIGTIPLLLAELLNPYVLCLTRNQLRWFSFLNLAGRLLGFIFVYFFWKGDAYWVNAWVGSGLLFFFLLNWFFEISKKNFRLNSFSKIEFISHLKENFSLVLSNGIVHFQQAFLLYLIGFIATPMVWSVYAIIDKIIWGFRTLLISFSGAVYALSLKVMMEGWQSWRNFKIRINQFLLLALMFCACINFIFAPKLASFFRMVEYQQGLTFAIKLASIIPLLTGLNLMNVLELLLKKRHHVVYRTNLTLMAVVMGLGGLLVFVNSRITDIPSWAPVIMLVLIELITLVAYEKSCRYSS
ncbi:MAG: hypothetical protein EBQ65_00255 [Chitinophagaceae bacterium]|nr:hypothetical protein [Chitinophagaceae bacterium]